MIVQPDTWNICQPIPAADEVDWDEIRSAVAKAAWPSSGLVDEAMTRIRAAIAAMQATRSVEGQADTFAPQAQEKPNREAASCPSAEPAGDEPVCKFTLGQRVPKTKGSKWTGRVVGFYSTALTPTGYAVESETETGSVQIYPEAALAAAQEGADCAKVAARLPSALGERMTPTERARSDAEAILGRLRAGGYRASIANVEKLAKHVMKLTAPVAVSAEGAE